jgi:hypothetical protein
LNFRDARSGVREPSGDCHARSRSIHSVNPPGLVFLGSNGDQQVPSLLTLIGDTHWKHWLIKRGQFWIAFPMNRQWM